MTDIDAYTGARDMQMHGDPFEAAIATAWFEAPTGDREFIQEAWEHLWEEALVKIAKRDAILADIAKPTTTQ